MDSRKNHDCLVAQSNRLIEPVATSRLFVGPLNGKKTIVSSPEVFTSYISTDFLKWKLDKAGDITPSVDFQVFNLVQDGKLQDIFAAFDPERVNLSQNQIVEFCRFFPEQILPVEGSTFMPFQENNFLYVAVIKRFPDGLFVLPRARSDEDVLFGGLYKYRIIVPEFVMIGQ